MTETIAAPQTYMDTTGKIFTKIEVKNDYRKARIAAGQTIAGPEYEDGLKSWYSTYTEVTAKEQSKTRAPFVALMIGISLTVFFALVAGATGGVLAFILVFVVGVLLSMGLSAVVTMFTMPTRS
jgi:hypothetical protein